MYMEFTRFIDFAYEHQMESMGLTCHNEEHASKVAPLDDVVMWYEIALGRERWQNVYVRIPKTFTDADMAPTGIVSRHRPFSFDHGITMSPFGPKMWPDLLDVLRTTQGPYHIELDGVSYGGQSFHVPYASSFDGKCEISFEDPNDRLLFKLVWKDASLLVGSDDA